MIRVHLLTDPPERLCTHTISATFAVRGVCNSRFGFSSDILALTNTQHLVIYGGHRWNRERVPVLCSELGYTPLLVMNDREQLPSHLESLIPPSHILRLTTAQFREPRHVAGLIRQCVGSSWLTLALDDYVSELAASVALCSGNPIGSPFGAHATLDKPLLRAMWNSVAPSQPLLYQVPFRIANFHDLTLAEVVLCEDYNGFCEDHPCIVKPSALDASIAVRRLSTCRDFSVVQPELAKILLGVEEYCADSEIAVKPRLLFEHEIPRHATHNSCGEFSVEFLSLPTSRLGRATHHLLGITHKYIDAHSFVEVGHCFPAFDFPPRLLPVLLDSTAYLLDRLGVDHALSHWEYIVTPDKRLALVEAQLRPGGDHIMEVVNLSMGRSPYEMLLARLLPPSSLPKTVLIGFLYPQVPLNKVSAVECDADISYLRDRRVFIDEASLLADVDWSGPTDCFSKHISVLGVGSDAKAALHDCMSIARRIKLLGKASGGKLCETALTLPECLT